MKISNKALNSGSVISCIDKLVEGINFPEMQLRNEAYSHHEKFIKKSRA